MTAAMLLRQARSETRTTQAQLAARAGTSQATISAYESGRKQPSVDTLDRLLGAMGRRLTAEPARRREPSRAEHERVARGLVDVMALAAALPTRHEPVLRYPRLRA